MRSIEWLGGSVRFLDQSRLPTEESYVETDDESVIAQAIRSLAVRGAPLIGIAVAYGFALAIRKASVIDERSLTSLIEKTSNLFRSTRPTAVNLFWAVERMRHVAFSVLSTNPSELSAAVLAEARAIHREDEEHCSAIGRLGAELLPNAANVLTHCNTGSLATGGDGTAQSVLKTAWKRRTLKHVYVDETRPLFQGARLTAWELQKLGIPSTLITDSTAAFLLQQGKVNAIIVGADRITAGGDVANKVGTYGLAVQAQHHNVPFYVAAPSSTFDRELMSGKEIHIEQRSAEEVTVVGGRRIAPVGVEVYAPAFDVTPSGLVTAIITERGVLHPPYDRAIAQMFGAGEAAVRR